LSGVVLRIDNPRNQKFGFASRSPPTVLFQNIQKTFPKMMQAQVEQMMVQVCKMKKK